MIYGYLLDKAEISTCGRSHVSSCNTLRKLYEYPPSEELFNFNNNLSKVALLLTTSEKCLKSTIIFDSEDMDLFVSMKKTFYHNCSDIQTQDMKSSFYQILIEQSIVSVISSWECYFYDIFERILNDDDFLAKLTNDDETFNKFLNLFNIQTVYANFLEANQGSIIGLKLGTKLLEKKKINCQDTDHVKDLLKTLFNIKIVDIEPESWNSIYNLFQDRHTIIHNKKSGMTDEYSKEKIEKIASSIYNYIKYIDKRLFLIVNNE
jgi:hypothetical protein